MQMDEFPNDPLSQAWQETLNTIEDLMQLGLLQNLKGARIVNLRDAVLELAVSSERVSYLSSEAVRTHLLVLAKPCFEKYGLRLEDIRFTTA